MPDGEHGVHGTINIPAAGSHPAGAMLWRPASRIWQAAQMIGAVAALVVCVYGLAILLQPESRGVISLALARTRSWVGSTMPSTVPPEDPHEALPNIRPHDDPYWRVTFLLHVEEMINATLDGVRGLGGPKPFNPARRT